jgi:hypothetical protein
VKTHNPRPPSKILKRCIVGAKWPRCASLMITPGLARSSRGRGVIWKITQRTKHVNCWRIGRKTNAYPLALSNL